MECKTCIYLFWGFFLELDHVIQYSSFIFSLVTLAGRLHWFPVIIYYHLVPLFFTSLCMLKLNFYSVTGTPCWIRFITFVYISCSGILFCYLCYAVLLISLVCAFLHCSTYNLLAFIHATKCYLMLDNGKYQRPKNLFRNI